MSHTPGEVVLFAVVSGRLRRLIRCLVGRFDSAFGSLEEGDSEKD